MSEPLWTDERLDKAWEECFRDDRLLGPTYEMRDEYEAERAKQAARIAELESELAKFKRGFYHEMATDVAVTDELARQGERIRELEAAKLPVSDEQIDALVASLDNFCKEYGSWVYGLPPKNIEVRAIVRQWMPTAMVCPKRVRVTKADTGFWYGKYIGEVFGVECLAVDPNGERWIYVECYGDNAVRYADCEPVPDEGVIIEG